MIAANRVGGSRLRRARRGGPQTPPRRTVIGADDARQVNRGFRNQLHGRAVRPEPAERRYLAGPSACNPVEPELVRHAVVTAAVLVLSRIAHPTPHSQGSSKTDAGSD
ncbi:hypothetical protein V6U90_25645 [Micromonospora sp. CPCC 206060]|uniref:hypothetical protein n=1 Tax=Micromonospora sp. CPCC 206060 TaxID=3122406 RepID=UPI002FF0B99A